MAELYGVIFDVDGVIADTEAVNARFTVRVFTELSDTHGVERQDFDSGVGRGAEEYAKAGTGVHSRELT